MLLLCASPHCGGNLWLEQDLVPQLGRRGRSYTVLVCTLCAREVEVDVERTATGWRLTARDEKARVLVVA